MISIPLKNAFLSQVPMFDWMISRSFRALFNGVSMITIFTNRFKLNIALESFFSRKIRPCKI